MKNIAVRRVKKSGEFKMPALCSGCRSLFFL